MPRTRSGVASNQSLREGESNPQNLTKSTSKGLKKRLTDGHGPSNPAKKTKTKTKPKSEANEQETRPRLTTPDLEFDYDKSQLRDPRETPGRVKRPRHEGMELSHEWKSQFYIPEPKKPSGRLNAEQKDALFGEKALLDPSETFHDLHVCHKKGPDGSPTYDSAGFQLDWHKVDRWMKPKPYNKRAMIRGMERSVDKAQKDNRQMSEIFFEDGKPPIGVDNHIYEHYMKDHVSKDLGIPIHQIATAHFRDWEQKGFTKPNAKLWWHEPNGEEKNRALKMLCGASLRKDL
jgi:hypothetical protein